ncbi:fumarylacetoacetate hydrolase family protein [Noviherbaspirillum galbum]|uniref:Hydratase n=1 Tax=Noviherbaspirillum galbum TaxID=2709383 RepID=A0A6B3STD0_9BURK|nr:fumarylacetoacetate hydrolase family protein [Noviherbaspirillum galbum]NEX62096.1 hydratase [Noviherbaspirillum galbum]
MTEPFPDTAQAASILATRRMRNDQGPRLPEACRPPGMEAALDIQFAVTARLGLPVAGWKCALPAGDKVIVAPIYRNLIRTTSPYAVNALQAEVRIEPELAFVLGHDLPARETPYIPDEVDAAISRTHLALELIGSRYESPDEVTYEEHLADGLLNQGLYLGPEADGKAASSANRLNLSLTIGAGETAVLDGHHPAAAPRAPLHWLAEFLRARGQGLQAGQVIITGSYVNSFTVPAGQDIALRFGSLGELKVHFSRQ